MEDKTITLTTKPGASLHISVLHPQPPEQNPLSDTLVVFLNGLMLPCAAWSEAIDHLLELRKENQQPLPALLCYDRYGQGKSDSDPTDTKDSPYGHDVRAAAADLHQLLIQVSHDELHRPVDELRIILVCNSIGCTLARLYAAEHPGLVEAYLFLDSMMANTDFVSLFPDPDDPEFDGSRLPEGVSADDLRHARSTFGQHFHPTVPNPEHLDRRQLGELLPHADGPRLPDGPGGRSPLLVVVGHDWDEFAEQSEKSSLSVSKAVTNAYMNPAWGAYNKGLTRLVQTESEVKIAKGCGHFIQKDGPGFVAGEISGILNELQRRRAEGASQ
ncbi:Alpha/Beta hydrolase protein [Achaetomium macrosporum]|uniref:Alpha/Beta hydrolase protein n=1 Tax=Achaetomium macrosporum TaxID=79813 RepID=A0AAN7HF33_9PEZI|nr:Alpha/Beta hydrolase protein [Achaetomium macrosporum]